MTEWQNESMLEPGFQDICRDECAISNSNGMDKRRAVVLLDDTEIRSAAFGWARSVIGKGGTYALEALAHGAITDDQEIQDKASQCVARIRDGDCPRFVIAGEELPEEHRGVKSHKLYEYLKENLKEE